MMKREGSLLKESINKRILVLDGAMGTAIQGKNLSPKDFGGAELEGCNENLVLTRPDIIQEIHESYLKAGCDIVETNTFGATPLVLDEYGLGPKAYEINVAAARLARKACEKFATPDQPRFVAGSIGPTTKAISVTGGVTFEELIRNFYEQARGLFDGGVDYFLIETCQDTRNIKAALLALDTFSLPIAISGTIEPMGTMLAGQPVEALLTSVMHHDLLYIGLNCATGPEFMTDHIRSLSKISPFPVACVPNAGLPDEDGHYLETPQMVGQVVERFLQNGWVNLLGGCCGTTPEHIGVLSELAKKYPPRKVVTEKRSVLSGVEYLEITEEMRPVIVGERTNVIGSKKFKELICAEGFDEASEIARAQVKKGAQIIDVCLANPDREELADMERFLEKVIHKIKVPLMIDSTDAKVIERALTYCQGKAIINSINLEDGEERFEDVVPFAKKFGAALVVGCIDDDPKQGMAVTRQRKLEVAERSYDLLVKKYGVAEEDIYWDALVFPCATGDQQYVGSAVETIEGIRLIKQKYPRTKTVLGVSNVSFGLPTAGREVLNSVFLHHCVEAGLDLAIVNSEKLERFSSIPPEEVKLSDDLLWNRGADPIATFAAHFREQKSRHVVDKSKIPLEERLAGYIIEGSKDGLANDLKEALKKYAPLEIINGPLMKGMDEVGRLFNDKQLIVAEVLQSAESMKAAVAFLEPHMEKNDSASRGKILLATVKGDVHDIGKNLVDIILSNNGFEVINLGIKVPPEQLIAAIKEHRPDIVGLSGLLVKSAQQMVVTAEDFSKAGTTPPMLVGGAALSSNFVDRKISVAYEGTVLYASDAMNGLSLAKTIVDEEKFTQLKKNLEQKRQKTDNREQKTDNREQKHVSIVENPPQPPDFNRHIVRNTAIEQIWAYINPLMLYGRHLGLKGDVIRKWQAGKEIDPKSKEIFEAVETIKEKYKQNLKPKAIYQFFKAESEGNSLRLTPSPLAGEGGGEGKNFVFPRKNLCLADFANPKGTPPDNVALFCTTVGEGIREIADDLKNKGAYLDSIALQMLALESAEAYAEWLHTQIRRMWGFPDTPETTMMDRFQAKYRGKRYSFGYPACPNLEDQKLLFELLKPEEIGLQLTEGFMMEPEASVSAIVFHHPQAIYFSVLT
ncbi:MAG: methionine synthase [Deltaproteobacteria bacterium]|nr:methionine synthase [Deltaproteobacteria bacterium]